MECKLGLVQTHPVNILCGMKPMYAEKTTTFGGAVIYLQNFNESAARIEATNAVQRLRMRELLSELRFQLVQRLRKSIPLGAFMKL